MTEAYLGLGSNLGDRTALIGDAVRRLDADDGIDVVLVSSLYETPPWGNVEQDAFLNAALRVETRLGPHALLDRCLAVEAALGRVRARRWGPRTIDIDILTYADVALTDDRLTLPHRHLLERAFVLVPLLEIAPALVVSGRPIADALAGLDRSGITRIGGGAEPRMMSAETTATR